MPFIETALFGTGSDDNIAHFGAVRYRVDGSGVLISTLYGYNKVTSSVLKPVSMVDPASREITRLANFKSERALLRIETNEIDEVFQFNRIIFFLKDLYTSYPG